MPSALKAFEGFRTESEFGERTGRQDTEERIIKLLRD